MEKDKTDLLASEHNKTICFVDVLKTLKKRAVYSSRFFEAKVKSPNGPTPPSTFDPLLAQRSWASSQLGLNSSALSKLGI